MAGINNFVGGKYPSVKVINSKLREVTHTNIVMTSVPLPNNESKYVHKFVHKYNEKMKEYAARLDKYACGNVSFLDVNYCSPREVTKRLASDILSHRRAKNKNLVFVRTTDLFTVPCGSECLDTVVESAIWNKGEADGSSVSGDGKNLTEELVNMRPPLLDASNSAHLDHSATSTCK